jgi:hypothetical protein
MSVGSRRTNERYFAAQAAKARAAEVRPVPARACPQCGAAATVPAMMQANDHGVRPAGVTAEEWRIACTVGHTWWNGVSGERVIQIRAQAQGMGVAEWQAWMRTGPWQTRVTPAEWRQQWASADNVL